MFYTYVSQLWIGSFGLMTAILAVLFYLNSKKKLGALGFIVTRQIHKISKSRKAKIALAIQLFALYVFGNFIFGVETAPTEIKQAIDKKLEERGITNTETLIEKTKDDKVSVTQAIFGLLLLLIPNPIAFAFFSSINDLTDGWAMHWATVFVVEAVEYVSIFIYFRRKKSQLIEN